MPKTDQERLDCFMIGLKRRNPSEPEFAQAVYEVALDIIPSGPRREFCQMG